MGHVYSWFSRFLAVYEPLLALKQSPDWSQWFVALWYCASLRGRAAVDFSSFLDVFPFLLYQVYIVTHFLLLCVLAVFNIVISKKYLENWLDSLGHLCEGFLSGSDCSVYSQWSVAPTHFWDSSPTRQSLSPVTASVVWVDGTVSLTSVPTVALGGWPHAKLQQTTHRVSVKKVSQIKPWLKPADTPTVGTEAGRCFKTNIFHSLHFFLTYSATYWGHVCSKVHVCLLICFIKQQIFLISQE